MSSYTFISLLSALWERLMYFLKIDSVHVLFQGGSYIPTEGLLPKARNVGTLFTKQVFCKKD